MANFIINKGSENDIMLTTYYKIKEEKEINDRKLNNIAERISKGLLKLAETNSLQDLLRTQRFLLNTQDENGNTPIHLAILHGNSKLLEAFVEVAATISKENIINIRNNKCFTPLMIAAYLGQADVCGFLLENQADLTLSDLYGCNALHVACKYGNLNQVKTIVKHINKNKIYSSVINAVNNDGFAPVHLAVLSESSDIVNELIHCSYINVNIKDKNPNKNFTALHYASIKAKLAPIVNVLCNNKEIQIDATSYAGCTPLHLAIVNKNYLITICLVSSFKLQIFRKSFY